MATKSQSDIERYIKKSPLYHHWFAVELYNQCQKIADEKVGDDASVELCGDSYTVKSESLNTICGAFRTLSTFALVSEENDRKVLGAMGSYQLGICELTATSYFARHLDRFLFPDGKTRTGACFHQFPVYKQKSGVERCDVYVAQMREDGCPGNPILLGVAKTNNLNAAKVETSAHCSRSHRVKDQQWWVTSISLRPSGYTS